MAFVSGAFILFILVISLFYFLVKRQYRWIVLLVGSYIFYWINSKYLVFIMLYMTLLTFTIARVIESRNIKNLQYLQEHPELGKEDKRIVKQKNKKYNKIILVIGIILNLSVLLTLKYFNFFAESINELFWNLNISVYIEQYDFLLPLGISFYTLQAIAYMTDVYRGKFKADKNPLKFMLFMSYFPQIVQGPIARYDQLAEQLYQGHDYEHIRVTHGMQLILWGFMKKLIIADRIAIPVNMIFNNSQDYSGMLVLLAAIGYGIQVYADFSGGMDIARGVSQIFGIELQLNFKQPYFARSIEEFWRRWHITLGAWMKDYVFYPLSLSKLFGSIGKKSRKLFGNKIGKKLPSFIAMFIVYFLVGLWHGAEWKYIVYGIWNGIFIMSGILLDDVYIELKKTLKINEELFSWKIFQILRTFLLCSIGRFFSRGLDVENAISMIKSVTDGFFNIAFFVDKTLLNLGLDTANWVLLIVMLAIMLLVDIAHEKNIKIRNAISKQGIVFRWIVYYLAFFAVLIFGIYGVEYDSVSFIYQQF